MPLEGDVRWSHGLVFAGLVACGVGSSIEEGAKCDSVGQRSCANADTTVLQCANGTWNIEQECAFSESEECVNSPEGAFCSVNGETCDTDETDEERCGFGDRIEVCTGQGWVVDRECNFPDSCEINAGVASCTEF